MNYPEPTGYRLLIRPVQPKAMSKGGIALAQETQHAQEVLRYVGEVVAMGPEAYQHEKFHAPWCAVGDWIAYGQYAGQEIKLKTDEGDLVQLRIINDDEVLAKVDPSSIVIYDV